MFRKLSLAGAAIAMTAGGLVAAAPAEAQRYYGDRYERGYNDGRYYDRRYDDRRQYRQYRDRRGYNSYRARQKCNDGDGGTIVGAIAGGLLGRTVDTRGDRLLGTVLGAGAGALAGRAIDRSDRPNYCRR